MDTCTAPEVRFKHRLEEKQRLHWEQGGRRAGPLGWEWHRSRAGSRMASGWGTAGARWEQGRSGLGEGWEQSEKG